MRLSHLLLMQLINRLSAPVTLAAKNGKQNPSKGRKGAVRKVSPAKKGPSALARMTSKWGVSAAQLKANRERWMPWASAVAVLLLVAVSFQWLRQDNVLPIRNLDVTGRFQQLTVQEVVAAARPHVSTGFFKVDLAAVQNAVQQLPWAARVEVQRVWPDGLRIRVIEQKPWAQWRGVDEQPGLINVDAELFASDEQALRVPLVGSNLPKLSGPAERVAELVQQYRELKPKFATVNEQLLELSLSGRGEWTAHLAKPASAGGVAMPLELRLGEAPFDGRLKRFLRLRADKQAELNQAMHKVAYLDLRYPHGVAVGWHSEQLAANR